nr:hypothetical protein [Tanacetum cinerariifolium]
MNETGRLKARVKLLEDREGVVAERSGDDAPIKGKNFDEGEAATERVSNDTEEMAIVLTSMDATTVLASGVADVPTGSGSILTAGPPAAEVPTGSDAVPTAELISDLIRYQDNYAKVHKFQTQQRKPWSKKQKRDYYMAVIKSNLGWKVKDFRGMTFEEIEAKFNTVWKQIEDFIPIGSKEEAKRFKRKGIRFKKESMKKLKTSEEDPKEVKTPDEVPKEKVKEMMQLVPIEEVYVEALQVKHPIIYRKVYTEGQRSYWKITRLGGSLSSYQFFVDLLNHLDREDLNQLWALVKESLNIRPALIKWKLYDPCEVHHVTSKYNEIFMLIEKDYPLRKGLAIVMICYKLQVENYSQIANDLILKIYKISNCPSIPTARRSSHASEESSHCQKKREGTAVKIALLLKSRRNYQSKSDDSYTKSSSPPHLGKTIDPRVPLILGRPFLRTARTLIDVYGEEMILHPNDNLFDTIPKMFTDEHTLDYSSAPSYDDVDDDLVELESDNDDVYDDPFDSKEDKIKESKVLIDKLDPPRSNKVFNPGILIHENLCEVTIRVTPDKNVKKISISNDFLILEDFNPPLYELPFHKEVPRSKTLLSFSSENEENFFNLGILTSKGVHTFLFPELSHRGPKAFKVTKIFESPMEIFPYSYGEDIRILDISCLHFYPP